ncbi:MAG: HAD-IIIA family hydrolase [Kiritimatiellaeota bacterium]|nr:HAD-IIIA family hydrolase [Kiritimatiellota bacterium]
MQVKFIPPKAERCVFFDRDGIVNTSPGAERYVLCWAEFHLLPEFVEALRVVRAHGYQAVIVTNQRAVARGLVSVAVLKAMHRRLRDLLRKRYSLDLLDVVYCPHDAGECECRKPAPGMLQAMARKHNLDLAASWMVGDAETDIEAGRRAGCRTIRVNGDEATSKADWRVAAMKDLPDLLEKVL